MKVTMSYTQKELLNIFEYNYNKVGLVESIFKMMNHMKSIISIPGPDKKLLIIDAIITIMGIELTVMIDETIEFLFKTNFLKKQSRFLKCVRLKNK